MNSLHYFSEAEKEIEPHYSEADTSSLDHTSLHYPAYIQCIHRYHPFAAELLALVSPEHLIASTLGVDRSGATLFWHRNIAGRVVNAKKIYYKSLHRDKEKYGVSWLYSTKRGYTTCLYNEHLLSLFPNKPVVLFESEKTALILSGLNQDALFLATGGASALRRDQAELLSGRNVRIAYDNDDAGNRGAEKAGALLHESGANVVTMQAPELIARAGLPPALIDRRGADAADMIETLTASYLDGDMPATW